MDDTDADPQTFAASNTLYFMRGSFRSGYQCSSTSYTSDLTQRNHASNIEALRFGCGIGEAIDGFPSPITAGTIEQSHATTQLDQGKYYSQDMFSATSLDQTQRSALDPEDKTSKIPLSGSHNLPSSESGCPQLESDNNDSSDSSDRSSMMTQDDKEKRTPYSELIFRALLEAEGNQMALRDIYKWIAENTDKVKDRSAKGWQNSVRHNLSMNGAFTKILCTGPEKGSRRSFRWLLQDWAREHGVQSTTRYRKPTQDDNIHKLLRSKVGRKSDSRQRDSKQRVRMENYQSLRRQSTEPRETLVADRPPRLQGRNCMPSDDGLQSRQTFPDMCIQTSRSSSAVDVHRYDASNTFSGLNVPSSWTNTQHIFHPEFQLAPNSSVDHYSQAFVSMSLHVE